VIPVALLDLQMAIIVSIAWGMFMLGVISVLMAREQKTSIWHVVGEHWLIAIIVITITHYLGHWISTTFGGLV